MKRLYEGFYRRQGESQDYSEIFIADPKDNLMTAFKAALNAECDGIDLSDFGQGTVDIIAVSCARDCKRHKEYKITLVPKP